jgi:hypothetical protein
MMSQFFEFNFTTGDLVVQNGNQKRQPEEAIETATRRGNNQ